MTGVASSPEVKRRRSALALIAIGQLLSLSLWFSASAVAPQLTDTWDLSTGQAARLTLAVQIGFVVGALVSAMLNLADVVPTRRLFVASAIGGAARAHPCRRYRISVGPPDPGIGSCCGGDSDGSSWSEQARRSPRRRAGLI